MPTVNIWRVTIARLDKSKHLYSERHVSQPRRGEIVETVVGGKLVKAQIERHYLDRIKPGERAAWKVEAEEI